MPQISVIVPMRNEEKMVAELIRSLRDQRRAPDEIILVDGGSADATVTVARDLTSDDSRFRIIEAGPATPGRGRNVGIEAAAHDWIALTDAGMRVDENWLEALAKVADADPDLQVVYGNCEPIIENGFQRFAAMLYLPPRGETPNRWLPSSLLHRDAWRHAGGFPDLRAAEDLIFMERLDELGCKVGWAPKATVYWRIPTNLRTMFRRFQLYSKHNVWAGRQRYWHYGVARQYLGVLTCVILTLVNSPWWLLGLPLWLGARVGKSLWQHREGHGLAWLLNPVQFFACAGILLAIDAATFAGWLQALLQRDPSRR